MKARALLEAEVLSIRQRLLVRDCPHRQRDGALFELGINAGPRVGELCALNVGQLWQYGAAVASLELYETKGGRHRRVPLNRCVRETLASFVRWKEGQGEALDSQAALFCNRYGSRITRQGVDLLLKGLYARSHIVGKVTTHSLRKTFATQLSQRGAPIRVIQELLGHRNLNTTERYVTVTERDKIQAVEALVSHLYKMPVLSR